MKNGGSLLLSTKAEQARTNSRKYEYRLDMQKLTCLVATRPDADLQRSVHTDRAACF